MRPSEAAAAFEKLKSEGSGAIGKFYFRPKTSTKDELELVWAFQPSVLKNFTVKEANRVNPQVVGSKLTIGYGAQGSASPGEDFESLDEIIARFIEPMNDLTREVTGSNHTKGHRR